MIDMMMMMIANSRIVRDYRSGVDSTINHGSMSEILITEGLVQIQGLMTGGVQ
jgi:hypothetical protein